MIIPDLSTYISYVNLEHKQKIRTNMYNMIIIHTIIYQHLSNEEWHAS